MKKASTMSPKILEMYVFIHYNMTFEWLMPSVKDIVEAYKKINGKDPNDSDLESSDDEDEGGGEDVVKMGRERMGSEREGLHPWRGRSVGRCVMCDVYVTGT